MAYIMLCDNTSMSTASLPRPKWALTPLGKASVTPGSSTPDIDPASGMAPEDLRMLMGATGIGSASALSFLHQ